MIIPSHYQITVDITVIHRIPILKRVQKQGLLIITSPLDGITQSIQHPEQHQVERQRASTPSSQPNLSAGTRPLILTTVSMVVVLRLGTCQTIISTICTGHWLPPYALHLLCGNGMQG